MRFRMTSTLRFWVDVEYERVKRENASQTRAELVAKILGDFEEAGDAMRYLNPDGKIAWRATPQMMRTLADAEREAEDDQADLP
jgi:hypothetical protein